MRRPQVDKQRRRPCRQKESKPGSQNLFLIKIIKLTPIANDFRYLCETLEQLYA